jgi:sterol 14alpha-demethylase
MGLLNDIVAPLSEAFSRLGTGSQIGVVFAAVLFLVVALNVANQLIFKNPNEPPLVFHWVPFIGSTITYGMNPPKFFKEMRAKVRHPRPLGNKELGRAWSD